MITLSQKIKRLLFIVAIICCTQSLQGQENATSSNNSYYATYDSLQNEKMRLEVKKLENETFLSPCVSTLISIIGVLIAAATILWTVWNGLRTYKNQVQQSINKTISDLLVLLNDNSPNKRAGAAKALSKYVNLAADEMIASLTIENDSMVREIIEEALLLLPKNSFSKIVEVHQKAIEDKIILWGELATTKIPAKEIKELLNIPQDYRKFFKKYRYLYDYGRKAGINKKLGAMTLISDEFERRIQKIDRTIESTGKIITKSIRNENFISFLSDVDIRCNTLYKAKFVKQQIHNMYATNTICRHIYFSETELHSSNFSQADMLDTTLINTKIEHCNFSACTLFSAKGSNVKIYSTLFEEATLSKSSFSKLVSFNNSFDSCIMNKLNAQESAFHDSTFTSAELYSANFAASSFISCKFFRAKIANACFKSCTIKDTSFCGADLRGVSFENAVLENVDFSGADLKNIVTTGWKIKNCNLDQAKNYSQNSSS